MDRLQWVAMGLVILLLSTYACSKDMPITTLSSPDNEIPDSSAHVMLSVKSPTSVAENSPAIQVAISAIHSTFSWDTRLVNPQRFELPLLYVHRERKVFDEDHRTLFIDVSGFEGGAEIEFELLSWHKNVATGTRHREMLSVHLPDYPYHADSPYRVEWTLDADSMLSDFYSFRVLDAFGNVLWENVGNDRPDLVVLDVWDVLIDTYTIRITYAVLFPFDHGQKFHAYRLAPEAVTGFIERKFVPIIIDTWHTQFNSWGFGPIHPDWDPDKVIEIHMTAYPFALFDGTGTYTAYTYKDRTPYPERRLWWYTSSNSFQPYGLLEDGYKVVYAHEFFHMVQWNVLLSTGCSTQRWTNTFIEAQGKFVPSVQYPELEILAGHSNGIPSQYCSTAGNYLKERLNTSLQVMEEDADEKYDLALYWRFLYEQFEHMGIIRAALEEMTCHYDPDIVSTMDSVMDATLARFDGPFETFEASLVAFARTNYALRLEKGRCETANLQTCNGRFYDPQHTYPTPPLTAVLEYTGDRITYGDAIPASYGMDFVEIDVDVDHALTEQPLHVTLISDGARFNVEIWELEKGLWEQLRALTPYPEQMLEVEDGLHTFSIPHLDHTKYLKFALIITRLDPHEKNGNMSSYTLSIEGN